MMLHESLWCQNLKSVIFCCPVYGFRLIKMADVRNYANHGWKMYVVNINFVAHMRGASIIIWNKEGGLFCAQLDCVMWVGRGTPLGFYCSLIGSYDRQHVCVLCVLFSKWKILCDG